MLTDSQLRHQLINRIRKIPRRKLQELDDFAAKLESDSDSKTNILSFAGAWSDLDNTIFNDFTENIHEKRSSNQRRHDE